MSHAATYHARPTKPAKRRRAVVSVLRRAPDDALPSERDANALLEAWSKRPSPWLTPKGLRAVKEVPELHGPKDYRRPR